MEYGWSGSGRYATAPIVALSTELNNLQPSAGDVLAVSAPFSNNQGAFWADCEFLAGGAMSPTGDPFIEVWVLRSLDNGLTFEDGSATLAPARGADKTINIAVGTSITPHAGAANLELPPGVFKIAVRNQTGVAFPSGSQIRLAEYGEAAQEDSLATMFGDPTGIEAARIADMMELFGVQTYSQGQGAGPNEPAPTPAAEVGYNTRTFGPGVQPLGSMLRVFDFFGQDRNAVAATIVTNADGSITVTSDQSGYGAALCTASLGSGTWDNFSGIAFGGGCYAEATMSQTGGNTAPGQSFWGNDIESMNGGSVGDLTARHWPGQPDAYGNWLEVDIAEFNESGDKYGLGNHNFYEYGDNPAHPDVNTGGYGGWISPVTPATGIDWSQPHKFGWLWVPASGAPLPPTNIAPNSTCTGAVVGTPGTEPTNWEFDLQLDGLSRQIIAVGNAAPGNYVDVRIYGTANGTSDINLYYTPTGGVAALANHNYTIDVWMSVIAGTIPTSAYVASAYLDGSSNYLTAAFTGITLDGNLTEKTYGFLTNASTARLNAYVGVWGPGNGVAVDFTVRICTPQLLQSAASGTRGYQKFYFDGQQVGTTLYWDEWSASSTPPPAQGSTAYSVLDTRHMAFICGCGGAAHPMTVHALSVWQKDASNNIGTASVQVLDTGVSDYTPESVIPALNWLTANSGLRCNIREYHSTDRVAYQASWCPTVAAGTGAKMAVAIANGGGPADATTLASLITASAEVGWMQWAEGLVTPNDGSVSAANLVSTQQSLYAACQNVRSNPYPVIPIGPMLTYATVPPEAAAAVTGYMNASQKANVLNAMAGPSVRFFPPSNPAANDGVGRSGYIDDVTIGHQLYFEKPGLIGEWHPTQSSGDSPSIAVNDSYGAYYAALTLLHAHRLGVQAIFWKSLFDVGSSGNSPWTRVGLFPNSGSDTPRLPARTIRAMYALTGDTGSTKRSFKPSKLDYTVTGLPDPPAAATPWMGGHQRLYQNSGGTFHLFVWNEQSAPGGSGTTVTISFARSMASVVHYDLTTDPTIAETPVATQTNITTVSFSLTASVHLFVIHPQGSTAPAESAQGKTVVSSVDAINDASGVAWVLVSNPPNGYQASHAGLLDGININYLLYWDHVVWYVSTTGSWFYWSAGAWHAGTGDPRVSAQESPEGFTVTAPGTTLYASQTPGSPAGATLDLWTLTAGAQAARNGTTDVSTTASRELYYHNHTVYLKQDGSNSYGAPGWWWWEGVTWSECPAPKTEESAEGSQITTVGPLLTASQTPGVAGTGFDTFSLNAAGQVARNGLADDNTQNVDLIYYKNHTVYRRESTGNAWGIPGWFSWTGGDWAAVPSPALTTESTDRSTANEVGSVIYASQTPGSAAGATVDNWIITAAGTVARNGTVDASRTQTISLFYSGHYLYHQSQATNGIGDTPGWWRWGGTSWTAVHSPLPTGHVFTIGTMGTQTVGQAFSVSGTICGYGTPPTNLQYRDNAGAFVPVVAGSGMALGANGHMDQGGAYTSISMAQQATDLKAIFGAVSPPLYRLGAANWGQVAQFQALGIEPVVELCGYPNWGSLASMSAAYDWAYATAAAIVQATPSAKYYEIGNEWDINSASDGTFGDATKTGIGWYASDWAATTYLAQYIGVTAGCTKAVRDYNPNAKVAGGSGSGWERIGFPVAVIQGVRSNYVSLYVPDFVVLHWYWSFDANSWGVPSAFIRNTQNVYQGLKPAGLPWFISEWGSNNNGSTSNDAGCASRTSQLLDDFYAHRTATASECGVAACIYYELYEHYADGRGYLLYHYTDGATSATIGPQGSAAQTWVAGHGSGSAVSTAYIATNNFSFLHPSVGSAQTMTIDVRDPLDGATLTTSNSFSVSGTGTVSLSSITLSGTTVIAGSPGGTAVGQITVSTTGGAFSGSLTVNDTAHFQIPPGTNDIQTATALSAGTYTINITATMAGATGSPLTRSFSVQAVAGGNASVNLSAPTGKTLKKTLFGFGVDQATGHSYFPNSTFRTTANAYLKPALLRVHPNWELPRYYAEGNTALVNDFLSYYRSFCQSDVRVIMGCALNTSVSAATHASQAANFATYLNSAGFADILDWEIGNEWGYTGSGVPIDTVISYFNTIADALHTVNPSYRCWGPPQFWSNSYDTAYFANQVGTRCAGVPFHSVDVAVANSNIMEALDIAYDAKGVSAQNAVAQRSALSGTPLASVPIGPMQYNMGWMAWQNGQHIGAVWAACYLLGLFKSTTNVDVGAVWQIANDTFMGTIANIEQGSNPAAVDLQGYFLGYAGQNLYGTEYYASTSFVNLLVVATKPTATTFAICLVNYDLSNDRTVNLTLSGGVPTGSISRWQIAKSTTFLAPGDGRVFFANGHVYSLDAGMNAMQDEIAMYGGGGSGAMAGYRNAVYAQDNGSGTWWTWVGTDWTQSSAPPAAVTTPTSGTQPSLASISVPSESVVILTGQVT